MDGVTFPVYDNIVDNWREGIIPLAVVFLFIYIFFRWVLK